MGKFSEKGGIKMERNGKNGVGLGGASARGRVAFARVKVVLARVGVGTGPEKGSFFSTKERDWGKFRV